jgi:hypothetical protein
MTRKALQQRNLQILDFAQANPTLPYRAVAAKFGLSRAVVNVLLISAGIHRPRTGAPPKPKAGQSSEAHDWEKILHAAGLGMDRGLRIKGARILYSYDPRKESFGDRSATCNPDL